MANRAFVFRMHPDRRQEDLIARTFGCCRPVWNRMLTGKRFCNLLTRDTLRNTPARLKDRHRHPWLREIYGMALCNVRLDMERAFASFLRTPAISDTRITRAGAGTGRATPRTSSGQTSPSRTRGI
ncbi:MAG: helix-turn-helix domain-containing protein [Deltaproteobacteria bacterium]|jgi:putative transposase|nr:helix-turn-helix domain-containing protein [Deltaproteobacteria bacterium]